MARYVFADRLSVRTKSVNAAFSRKISLLKTRLRPEIRGIFAAPCRTNPNAVWLAAKPAELPEPQPSPQGRKKALIANERGLTQLPACDQCPCPIEAEETNPRGGWG